MPPIPPDQRASLETRLRKRGFKIEDPQLHVCTVCQEQAVIKYVVAGRTGGRDISLCQACGVATSWRNTAGLEGREQDLGFDLEVFLR